MTCITTCNCLFILFILLWKLLLGTKIGNGLLKPLDNIGKTEKQKWSQIYT